MAGTFKLYKLIILYMLDMVDFPLTNSQISEFILSEGYTDYFKLQQTISELIEEGFIHEESTHSRTFYHLTEEGEETLYYFREDISSDIRHDIDVFLKEKKYELKNAVSVKADYYPNVENEYCVHCRVLERGQTLIDLTVTVPTEEQAQTVAGNWSKKNQEVYALIMANLL